MNITVVIPLYNKANHIQATIDSVLNQTFQNFEIIVVDDGSSDGGGNIVRQFQDPRITLIQQNNSGVSKARNTGIQHATGDLIAFLDGDDLWLPNHLADINELTERFPEGGMYATAYACNQNHHLIPLQFYNIPEEPWEGIIVDYFKTLYYGNNITWTSAVAVKKKVFEQIGYFPEGVRMGEDLDMWIRIALNFPVCFSSKVSAIYNMDAENRACRTYNEKDLSSILFTRWFEYLAYNHLPYLQKFVKKTQLNHLYNLIVFGFGKQLRQTVIPNMFRYYGIKEILPYYGLSFFSKTAFDLIRWFKHTILRRKVS